MVIEPGCTVIIPHKYILLTELCYDSWKAACTVHTASNAVHTSECTECVCVFCCREPKGLKLLIQLYVERSHSLWKEPEVISSTLFVNILYIVVQLYL